MCALSPGPPALVGRDREIAILHDRLAAARGGRGSLVLISGEAGIGKTALADTLVRDAAGASVTVLAGHCYDRTETPPYGPWVEIARRLQARPDTAITLPVPHLDGATSQGALFAETQDFLAAMAAQRPLVLVLEDLHWADNASLDLLRFIAHGLAAMPLLLVVTYRGEELDRRHPLAATVPLLVREAPDGALDLRPLDAAASEALVRCALPLPDGAAARLAAYLMERTEGNALFITELLRTLEEERLLIAWMARRTRRACADAGADAAQADVDARLTRLGRRGGRTARHRGGDRPGGAARGMGRGHTGGRGGAATRRSARRRRIWWRRGRTAKGSASPMR